MAPLSGSRSPPLQFIRLLQPPYGTASAVRLFSNRCSVQSGPSRTSSTSLRSSTSGCGCGCALRRRRAALCLHLLCCPSCSVPSTRCIFKCSSTPPTFQPSLTSPACSTHPLAFLMRRALPRRLVRTACQQTLQQLLTTVQPAHRASQHSIHCYRHSCQKTGNLPLPSAHFQFSPLTLSRRKQLQQLLSFAPKNMSIMRRTPVDSKRGPAAAVTDVENRRQMVADTLLQLQHRERRLQEAEHCVNASYIFFTSTLQVVSSTSHIRCSLLLLVV